MTLVTVTPGPTIRIYRDGDLMLEMPLDQDTALRLIADLAKETRNAK